MLRLDSGLRVLGPTDLPEVEELLASDPVINVFVAYRAQLTRLDPRWLGGQMWGWYDDGDLLSVCHSAANLVPAMGTPDALKAFAKHARLHSRSAATLVGPQRQVKKMWKHLRQWWPRPRDERWNQPHLQIDHAPLVVPDAGVRPSRPTDLGTLYPACVEMYTEEVGVSPELGGGRQTYRARVAQLVNRGWSLAKYDARGQVEFKAEISAATSAACQVQGVWVRPDLRGRGLATAGMASVVEYAREHVAPVISLYVNDHNLAARRAYQAVGFVQTETFATLMY